jgi:hypothetical protein
MEHTPLPWMRNGQTTQDWWRIDGSSERMGLDFLAHPTAIVPADADADFIVRAVNNHEALLEALEAFVRYFETPQRKRSPFVMAEVKEARAAILAAKKGD